jgi:hypothetical protein
MSKPWSRGLRTKKRNKRRDRKRRGLPYRDRRKVYPVEPEKWCNVVQVMGICAVLTLSIGGVIMYLVTY